MKKIFSRLMFSLAIYSSVSFADASLIETVTITNHFDEALSFYIGINQEILPQFSNKFVLNENNAVTSSINPIPADAAAYIRVESVSHPEKIAFLSVSGVRLSGYLSHGVAYSWDMQKNAQIIFCTPQFYKQQNHC